MRLLAKVVGLLTGPDFTEEYKLRNGYVSPAFELALAARAAAEVEALARLPVRRYFYCIFQYIFFLLLYPLWHLGVASWEPGLIWICSSKAVPPKLRLDGGIAGSRPPPPRRFLATCPSRPGTPSSGRETDRPKPTTLVQPDTAAYAPSDSAKGQRSSPAPSTPRSCPSAGSGHISKSYRVQTFQLAGYRSNPRISGTPCPHGTQCPPSTFDPSGLFSIQSPSDTSCNTSLSGPGR